MAEDFTKYLATEILSEQRTVSYRNVSRSLKVHVNAAKCMLYEFYKVQHDKKPDSIYATYLISGVKKAQKPTLGTNGATNGHKHAYDEDEPIPSSPPPFTSSMLEPSQQSSQPAEDNRTQVPVQTIALIREEGLNTAREQYETITSIHIYSLSPGRIDDLVTLTDIGRGLFTESFMKEDPLVKNKTFGVIHNPGVRRRKGKRPIEPTGPPPKFQPVKDEPKKSTSFFPTKAQTKQSAPAPERKTEMEETSASRPSSRDSTSTTGSGKQPTLKRDSSDLFKAFAKQSQQKPKSNLSRDQGKDDGDTKMADISTVQDEGESEDEALFLDTGTRKPSTKKRPSDVKKERDDRAAKLRKMMESDDESDSASGTKDKAPVKKASKQKDADSEPAEDKDEVPWSESDTEQKPTKPADSNAAPAASAGNEAASAPKRRRGKRKVMKKRTTKDEDGYLVTKEEAVWESFSEDEPEPKPKPAPPPMKPAPAKAQSQPKAGGGKSAAKKAGGNIMSFFGKKPS